MAHRESESTPSGYILGDAFDVLKGVSDGAADLVFTSPPGFHQTPFFEDQDVDKFLLWLQYTVFKELQRICKTEGFIVISQRNSKAKRGVVDVRQAYCNGATIRGWKLLTERIVMQHKFRHVELRNFSYQHMLVFTKKGYHRRSVLQGEYLQDVLQFPGDKVLGQTVWPPKFVDLILRTFSKKGDYVVDPFAGVGTVYQMCQTMGRRCLAVELDKLFFNSGYRVPARIF